MGAVPEPSQYQQAILAALSVPGDHLVIHATAGAGKTTVLVQIATAQPAASKQLFLAFARDAARELSRRLPRTTETRTVHSLGRLTLVTSLRSRNIELAPPQPAKYRRLANQLLRQQEVNVASSENAGFLAELADLVRLRLIRPDDRATVERELEESGIWPPADNATVDRLFALLPRLLAAGIEQAERGIVDFADMLYIPVQKQLPVPRYDLVCVDEAQDYSPLALELTLRLAAAGARLVFVGDPRQSIFGFAGADPEAMERISRRLSAQVMPLSVTYRCPRLHVELAQELAPEIEAAPGAPSGSVQLIDEAELDSWVKPGDLVLCRLNAPLIAVCLRLVRLGLPAYVRGADLKERLQRLAAEVFRTGLTDSSNRLERYLRKRLRNAGSQEGGIPLAATARLKDETACLGHLCQELPDSAELADLDELIERTFGGQEGTVTLSSIHRAKGQEADRVLLLYPELLPAPYARSLTALRGEACVQFVALTRARQELVIVQSSAAAEQGLPPPLPVPAVPAEDGERDRIIAAWDRVLLKASAGRRNRRHQAQQAGQRGSRRRGLPVRARLRPH